MQEIMLHRINHWELHWKHFRPLIFHNFQPVIISMNGHHGLALMKCSHFWNRNLKNGKRVAFNHLSHTHINTHILGFRF